MTNQFFGRKQELDQIKKIWDQITKEKSECANILVITGSTGEGKTRLIQRFYELLANDQEWNPHNHAYWPIQFQKDEGILRVNPELENHEPKGPPRFIWLGLRWQPLDARNVEERHCPIPEARKVLRMHNDQIKNHQTAWRKLWLAGKDKILGGMKESLTDTLLEYLPINGFALKIIGSFASILNEANKPKISRKENKDRVLIEDMDAFLDDFLQYFNTEKSIPLILFLDDAQWIDESTRRFLEKLLQEIKVKKLPVLILITHWVAEWNELKEGNNQNNLRSLCEENPVVVLNLNQIDSGSLKQLLNIKLPGLTSKQQAQLIQKSCDNFLSLEENIGYLLDTPQNFVDEDPTKELTETGENEIEFWEDDRSKRIKRQFNKLEKETKRLLGWSSQIGERFLANVIEDVAKQEALTSNSNVTFKKVEQLAYISTVNLLFKEFRDRAIFKIAQHYFRTYDSMMENSIKLAIKTNAVPLIHEAFDMFGVLKDEAELKLERLMNKNKSILDLNFAERRDVLGMLQLQCGLPNKELQSREEYTLSARILLLDFLNDYENDLIGKARSKAKEFDKIDWSYLVEEGIWWPQKLKLSSILNTIDCSETALKILEYLETDNEYMTDAYCPDDVPVGDRPEHDQLKAKCLLNLGRSLDSLNILLNLSKYLQTHKDFKKSTEMTESYANTAIQLSKNALAEANEIDIGEMLGIAADNFENLQLKTRPKGRIHHQFKNLKLAVWCLKLKFEHDMDKSIPYTDASSLTKAIKHVHEIYTSGDKLNALLMLFDVYAEGCLTFSVKLKPRSAKKYWKKARKIARLIREKYSNTAEGEKINEIMEEHADELEKIKANYRYYNSGKKPIGYFLKQFRLAKKAYKQTDSVANLEEYASQSFSVGNACYLAGDKPEEALTYLYISYSAHEELFIKKGELHVLENICRIVSAISDCESAPPSKRAKVLIEGMLPNLIEFFKTTKFIDKSLGSSFSRLLNRAGSGLIRLNEFINAKLFLEKSYFTYLNKEDSIGMPVIICMSRSPLADLIVNEIFLGNIQEAFHLYSKLLKYFEVKSKSSFTCQFLLSLKNSKDSQKDKISATEISKQKLSFAFMKHTNNYNELIIYQKKIIFALTQTRNNHLSAPLRIGVTEYCYDAMKNDASPDNINLYIISLLILTKSYVDDVLTKKRIMDEALLEFTKLKNDYPEFNHDEIDEVLSMAQSDWIGYEDIEMN